MTGPVKYTGYDKGYDKIVSLSLYFAAIFHLPEIIFLFFGHGRDALEEGEGH